MASEKVVQINNSLLNAVTPHGLEFFRNKIHHGEKYVKIFYISRYPNTLRLGWASKISNLPNTIFSQIFEPCDNSELINNLSSSVRQYQNILDTTRDPLERIRAEKSKEDAEQLIKQIDSNSEVIGYMSNIIMVTANTEEEMNIACRNLKSAISALGCSIKLFASQQEEAFKTLSPFHAPISKIIDIGKRNVPMSTVQGGFPFASSGFIDNGNCYPIGIDDKGGLIAINIWERSGDRTNSNIAVIGPAGIGKSTLIKTIQIKERMNGTVCISIDPEREYSELARKLGGDVVYAGGGGFIINPLQVRKISSKMFEGDTAEDTEDDTEDEFEAPGMSALALHMKVLETFFKLYIPKITDIQMAILKQILELLYSRFNINWDTDITKLKNTDFPIFADLYSLICQLYEDDKTEEAYKKELWYLKLIIRELAEGSDSFIWNGHTSVEPNAKFIVLDTNDLDATTDNVKKAQYYMILTWVWERMSKIRDEKVMLFADEAYLLVDPHVPQSLIFLRNIAKRARKYSSGLCTITHSVIDFLDPSVKMYGQALLDIPAYKFIMGADGQNLKDLKELYNLTEFEEEKLIAKRQRHALFFAGSRRFAFQVRVSPENLARMGKGGGK